MKNFPSSLFLLSFLSLLISACSSDSPSSGGDSNPKSLTVSPSTLSFSSEGGSQTLTISAPKQWNLTISESGDAPKWCSISETSGDAGSTSVNVTAIPNESYDERNVSLSLTCGGETKTVVVVQKQKDAILLTSDKIEISEEGGEFTVEVATNVDFTCEIAPQSQSWLKESPATRGMTTHTLHFTAAKNEFTEKREGTIIFTGAGLREEVTVYQSAASGFILSTSRQFLPSSAGRFSVELKSNVEYDWKVVDGDDWLHPDATRAMSSHTLFFNYDANPSELDGRTAKVRFVTEREDTYELDVVQHAKGKIILADKIMTVPASGGEFLISYQATSMMAADYPQWIETVNHVPATRGIEAYNLWLRVAPNFTDQEREGTLTIYDSLDPSLTESITLKQGAGQSELTVSCPEGSYNDARSHEFSVTVASNVPYELQIPSIFVSLGNGRYRLSGNDTERSATYYISLLVGGREVKSVAISQAAPITPSLVKDSFSLSADGGDFELLIKNNSDMKIIAPQDASWISLKNRKIADDGVSIDSWSFAVAPSNSAQPRNADIGVTGPGGFTATVRVTQSGLTPTVGSDGNVSLSVPGQLSEALGPDKMKSLEAISVSGEINGSDVATLRKMATDYALRNLDLSTTSLKADPQEVYFSGHTLSSLYPGKLTSDNQIGNFMFYQTKLEKVKLPANVTELGYRAFSESQITSIVIPEGVTKIGEDCFNGCHSLQSLTLPTTLKVIPKYAFFECYALRDLVVPEGVVEIGDGAFTPRDATSTKGNLISVTLPSTLVKIGNFAFNSQKLTSLEVPPSVRKMGWNTFKENVMLQKVVFHNSMDTLPRGTFESCSSLRSITLPSNLKVIGQSALAHTDFKSFNVPIGVTTLENGALEGMACTSLTLPSSLTVIRTWALGQLYYLKSITIPENVREMGIYALGSPCNLTEIHMKPRTVPVCDGEIFSKDFNYSGCTLYVPKGCKSAYSSHSVWGRFNDIREE